MNSDEISNKLKTAKIGSYVISGAGMLFSSALAAGSVLAATDNELGYALGLAAGSGAALVASLAAKNYGKSMDMLVSEYKKEKSFYRNSLKKLGEDVDTAISMVESLE